MNFYQHLEDLFHWTDLLIAAAYILIFFIIGVFIKGYYIKRNHSEYRYLLWAIAVKIIGVITFAFMYLSYYGDGDTIYYFEGSRTLSQLFLHSPTELFRLLFSSHIFDQDFMSVKSHITYSRSSEEWFLVQLLFPIVMLSFNRFIIAQILMAIVSLLGAWKLFQTFLMFYPRKQKEAFIAVFLVPSVLLWGGGVLKDTVSLVFISTFFYYSIKLFYLYQIKLRYFILLFISGYILFMTKFYILLSFIPALIIGWMSYNLRSIGSRFFRILIAPFIILVSFVGGYFLITNIQSKSEKYAIENIQSRAKGFHSWHTHQGGSSYNLGEIKYTPLGLIKKIPASINVTYFRPYLSEIYNVGTAVAGLESFLSLILFILLLWRYKLSWLKDIYLSPLLFLSLTYVIILGFIVGFISYNYGALSRYKIPAMPFFAYILFFFYFEYKAKIKE